MRDVISIASSTTMSHSLDVGTTSSVVALCGTLELFVGAVADYSNEIQRDASTVKPGSVMPTDYWSQVGSLYEPTMAICRRWIREFTEHYFTTVSRISHIVIIYN